jgi:hypothetical protein
MARRRSFRFGFPDVFAGRLLDCRVGVGVSPIRFAAVARNGALGSVLFGVAMSRDIAQEKARDQFPGAGSILAMLNIWR